MDAVVFLFLRVMDPGQKHVNDTNKLQVALVAPHLFASEHLEGESHNRETYTVIFVYIEIKTTYMSSIVSPPTPKKQQIFTTKIQKNNSPNPQNHVRNQKTKNKETKQNNSNPPMGQKKHTKKTTQTPGAPLEVVSRRATRKVVRLRSNAQRAPGVKVTGTRSRT